MRNTFHGSSSVCDLMKLKVLAELGNFFTQRTAINLKKNL